MNQATKLIDEIIQTHAEDITPVAIQKLGELRTLLTTKHEGNPDNVSDEINKAINVIAKRSNADMIVISLLPSEKGVYSASHIHIKNTNARGLLECIMAIPHAMDNISKQVSKQVPGFETMVKLCMIKEQWEG